MNRQHIEYESLFFANPQIRSTCFKMISLKETVNHQHIPGFDCRKTWYADLHISSMTYMAD